MIKWNGKEIDKTVLQVKKNKLCLNCLEKVKLKSDLIIFGNKKENNYYCYCVECYQYEYEEIDNIK